MKENDTPLLDNACRLTTEFIFGEGDVIGVGFDIGGKFFVTKNGEQMTNGFYDCSAFGAADSVHLVVGLPNKGTIVSVVPVADRSKIKTSY